MYSIQVVFAPLGTQSIVIAHRGCSALRPEHTMSAYKLAIEQGAEYIEPDIVSTKDGVLIARHENEISETTNVADHAEFADRKKTKSIDGSAVTGWFTEDFTLAEIKTLRAKERLGGLRKANQAFNDTDAIPTAAEVFALAKQRGVGVYPETKHPAYFKSINLPLEAKLVKLLADAGFGDGKNAFIQSFETENLKELKRMTKIPLVQLMQGQGGPADGGSYAAMSTPDGLKTLRSYASGIGVEKSMIYGTSLLADAHRAGLLVHAWTFRPEAMFVLKEFRGDARAELRWFLHKGVDGIFVDLPEQAIQARKNVLIQD
ncbi:glycerophosphodiester phosphodiesterase [bacterium]|nr:MAG: glycerophosphodiester phosphodiesterase [bacterium]